MESTSVILTFHSIEGKAATPDNEKVIHFAPKHFLGPFKPATVRSVEVGTKAVVYGNVIKNVEGAFVTEYLHLRAGKYTFTQPFVWLTLHVDNV